MPISSVDDIVAGAQPCRQFHKAATGTTSTGVPKSLFFTSGNPGAAAAPSSGIGGSQLTGPIAGQIPFVDATSGKLMYLTRFVGHGTGTSAGNLLLCDRLWSNSGLTGNITTEQVFTSSSNIPARDADGAALGNGVMAAVEIHTGTGGAGTPTVTLKYTDSNGNAGLTATTAVPTVASPVIGSFFQFNLGGGVQGVRRAESLTLSASWSASTNMSVVLYRPIARLEMQSSGWPGVADAFSSGAPVIYNGSVLFLVYVPSSTNASTISGEVAWTQV